MLQKFLALMTLTPQSEPYRYTCFSPFLSSLSLPLSCVGPFFLLSMMVQKVNILRQVRKEKGQLSFFASPRFVAPANA